jgi:hypothetical protein
VRTSKVLREDTTVLSSVEEDVVSGDSAESLQIWLGRLPKCTLFLSILPNHFLAHSVTQRVKAQPFLVAQDSRAGAGVRRG